MEIQLTMDANAREQVSLKNEFNNSHKRSSTIPVNKQLILLSKTFGKFDKIVRDVSPLVYRETRVTTTRQPKIEASSIFLNSGSSVLRPLDDMPNFFHWKSMLPSLKINSTVKSVTPETSETPLVQHSRKHKKIPNYSGNKKQEIRESAEWKLETNQKLGVLGVTTPTHTRFSHLRGLTILNELSSSFESSTAYTKQHDEIPKQIRAKPLIKRENKAVLYSQELSTTDERQLKETAYINFLQRLRLSNGFILENPDAKIVKFYVGPGNNSGMINWILRSRTWLTRTDSRKQASIIWTSTINKKTISRLQPSYPISTRACPAHLNFKKSKSLESENTKRGYQTILKSDKFIFIEPTISIFNSEIKIHNHIEGNKQLCTKKGLFKNLKRYYESKNLDPFEVLPLTFHISKGVEDPSFQMFQQHYKDLGNKGNCKNVWIIKPGEGTNRGHGIKVFSSLVSIEKLITSHSQRESKHTYIIQKYIENPLLICKRKFDIRCFGLLTRINGILQGYFYEDGYIRTSCKEFSVNKLSNRYIHLTNDAVQKKSDDYGKFEPGNKLSYTEFQEYLDSVNSGINFRTTIWERIKSTISDSFSAVCYNIDPHKRRHTFELFGYDFMVDENFKVWLIEANTNPCLELSCAYLSALIPAVVDNTFRIAIDPLFPVDVKKHPNWIAESKTNNKFQLVFSEHSL